MMLQLMIMVQLARAEEVLQEALSIHSSVTIKVQSSR